MNCGPEFRNGVEETQALGMMGNSGVTSVTRNGELRLHLVLGVGRMGHTPLNCACEEHLWVPGLWHLI